MTLTEQPRSSAIPRTDMRLDPSSFRPIELDLDTPAHLGASGLPHLQRLDWRFLLPLPENGVFEQLVICGGSPEITECLAETGLARQVGNDLSVSNPADAIVVLHDSAVGAAQAAKHLVPGGVLYYEVKRRSVGRMMVTPGQICRALRRHGLISSGVYAVTPDFASYRHYIPLDATGALKWFVDSRYLPLSGAQYLSEKALHAFTGLNGRFLAPFTPNYAIIARAGEADESATTILDQINVQTEFRDSPLHPILLTTGIDAGSRVIVLPFAADAGRPAVVLKTARTPAYNGNIEREQQTLAEIRARVDATMRGSIPCPLGVFSFGELTVGVEGFAPGRSLLASSWQWHRPIQDKLEDLRLAAEWLGNFHQQMKVTDAIWDRGELQRRLGLAIDRYVRTFGLTAHEESLFASVRTHVNSLVDVSVPITWRHIDFVPANVYREGRELTVIDWEDRGFDHDRMGPALCDLLHFVMHWSSAARGLHSRDDQLGNFRDVFLERKSSDRAVDMVRRVIVDYLQKLGMDHHLYPILLVYSSIEHALERLNRLSVTGQPQQTARSGNRYVEHIGILADHRLQLFAQNLLPVSP